MRLSDAMVYMPLGEFAVLRKAGAAKLFPQRGHWAPSPWPGFRRRATRVSLWYFQAASAFRRTQRTRLGRNEFATKESLSATSDLVADTLKTRGLRRCVARGALSFRYSTGALGTLRTEQCWDPAKSSKARCHTKHALWFGTSVELLAADVTADDLAATAGVHPQEVLTRVSVGRAMRYLNDSLHPRCAAIWQMRVLATIRAIPGSSEGARLPCF